MISRLISLHITFPLPLSPPLSHSLLSHQALNLSLSPFTLLFISPPFSTYLTHILSSPSHLSLPLSLPLFTYLSILFTSPYIPTLNPSLPLLLYILTPFSLYFSPSYLPMFHLHLSLPPFSYLLISISPLYLSTYLYLPPPTSIFLHKSPSLPLSQFPFAPSLCLSLFLTLSSLP